MNFSQLADDLKDTRQFKSQYFQRRTALNEKGAGGESLSSGIMFDDLEVIGDSMSTNTKKLEIKKLESSPRDKDAKKPIGDEPESELIPES